MFLIFLNGYIDSISGTTTILASGADFKICIEYDSNGRNGILRSMFLCIVKLANLEVKYAPWLFSRQFFYNSIKVGNFLYIIWHFLVFQILSGFVLILFIYGPIIDVADANGIFPSSI